MQDDMEKIEEIVPQMIARGIFSFKAFMAYAKRGMKLEDGQLLRLMNVVGRHGGLMAAHAENGDIIDYMEEQLIGQGQQTPGILSPVPSQSFGGRSHFSAVDPGPNRSVSHLCTPHQYRRNIGGIGPVRALENG